jgi:hypothetical protein
VVAGAILSYQRVRRQEKVEDLKRSIPELGQNHYAEKVRFLQHFWTEAHKTLTDEVKLTNFGAATPTFGVSKEDERSAALAARAQRGDYDDGALALLLHKKTI